MLKFIIFNAFLLIISSRYYYYFLNLELITSNARPKGANSRPELLLGLGPSEDLDPHKYWALGAQATAH